MGVREGTSPKMSQKEKSTLREVEEKRRHKDERSQEEMDRNIRDEEEKVSERSNPRKPKSFSKESRRDKW